MPLTILFRHTAHGPSVPSAPVEVEFDDEAIRIGRGSGCELRLPHHSMSEQHAVLRPLDGEWTLTDEASRNGTWVNGVRLTPKAKRAVRDGDLVRVGGVWLELRLDRGAVDARVNRSTRELALDIVGRFLELRDLTVTVVEGPDMGRRLALLEEDRSYIVGRSSRCDLKLVDEGASREHVRLVRRGGEVFVSDAGSKNAVSLGGARIAVGQAVRWPPSLALRAGRTVLALDVPPTFEAVAARVAVGEQPERVSEMSRAATEAATGAPMATRDPSRDVYLPESSAPRAAAARPVVSHAPGAAGPGPPRPKPKWGELTLWAGAVLILGLAIACIWRILS